MNKYYLFIIDKKLITLYKNKSYVLYKILETLYKCEAYDFCYGIKIYWQICNNFSVKLLQNYINTRIGCINKGKIIKIKSEKTYIQLMYPCIVVATKNKKNNLFKIFNIYNRNIFVCDFKNYDYFWLNDYLKIRKNNLK